MRLIDADELLKELTCDFTGKPFHGNRKVTIGEVRRIIGSMPTLTPVWRGCDLCLDDSWNRWIMVSKRFDHTNLSCGELALFCPGCGKPLTKEAVDIMLQRWAEVVDGS